jgi:hypothetical protein
LANKALLCARAAGEQNDCDQEDDLHFGLGLGLVCSSCSFQCFGWRLHKPCFGFVAGCAGFEFVDALQFRRFAKRAAVEVTGML